MATNYEELEKIAKLKEQGILSDEEFEIEKKNILNNNIDISKIINQDNANYNTLNTYYDNSKDEIFEKLFSYRGRLGRGNYIGYSLGVFILYIITIILVTIILDYVEIKWLKETSIEEYLQVLFLPFFYSLVIITIKRFHDLNKNGWSYLLLFIPFVNLYFGIILLFSPGTNGPNRFGSEPK